MIGFVSGIRFFIVLFLCFRVHLSGESENSSENPLSRTALLVQAQKYESSGNATRSFEERKNAYNRAADYYRLAGDEIGSVDIDLSLAGLYLRSGEYPWAILHYRRALKHGASTEEIRRQTKAAPPFVSRELDSSDPAPTGIDSFLLTSYLSVDRFYDLFYAAWTIAFVFLSLSIWFSNKRLRIFAYWSCAFFIYLSLNLISENYFMPVEGVLISSSGFYREPGENQSQIALLPLSGGTRVRILETSPDGEWVKVADRNGLIGYIPSVRLRVI